MIHPETLIRYSILLVMVGMIHDFLIGGVIYGWSSLVVALQNEGVYSDVCSSNDNGTSIHPNPGPLSLILQDGTYMYKIQSTTMDDDSSSTCNAQELKLAVIYTASSFSNTCATVVMGIFLDRYGPRATGILGGVVGMLGSLLFAFSSNSFDAFIPGMVLISLGGPAIHISHMHVAFLFPGKHAQVTSMFSGIYAASAFVFFVFLSLNQHTSITLRSMFLGYTLVVLLILLTAYLTSPTRSFDTILTELAATGTTVPMPRKKSENEELLANSIPSGALYTAVVVEIERTSETAAVADDDERDEDDDDAEHNKLNNETKINSETSEKPSTLSHFLPRTLSQTKYVEGKDSTVDVSAQAWRTPPDQVMTQTETDQSADPNSSELFNANLKTQFYSRVYVLLVLFMGVHVLRQNSYLGTLHLQLSNLGDSNYSYISAFGVIFPVFGSVTSLISGPIYDRSGLHSCIVIVNLLAILWSITGIIPNLPVQIVTFILFGVCNNFTYMTIWSSVGKIFGFTNFGTLAAVLNFLSAIFGLFIYPFLYITTELLDSNFEPGNIFLLFLVIPFIIIHIYTFREEIKNEIWKKQQT